MPYDLILPASLRKQGWKVKIREKERLEPPHVTITRKLQSWRLGLRDLNFLSPHPSQRAVTAAVLDQIRVHWAELRQAWDVKYPENPVGGPR